MATSVQTVPAKHVQSPFILWHLLSLDAPTVAALWVWFIARAEHVHLPYTAPATMALAVWLLYAADRILDVRTLEQLAHSAANEFEARHFFHHRHRRSFLFGIAVAAIALASMLHLLDPTAIQLYCIEASLLVAWFVILHATQSAHHLPKEIAVGIFFSAAVFIPTVARDPSLRFSLAPAAILFGATCSLNCLFLYAWEHEGSAAQSARAGLKPHFTTRCAIDYLPTLATLIAVSAGIGTGISTAPARPILTACAVSAVTLLILHHSRRHLSRTGLRSAADLALLTPALLLPFLR
ncbi:MAG TPA: hypothetical protein VGU46_02535 [Acidobacteriaceae bacterium]|nr:hypothetical protein [Acidobacteriaceae bacterium]